MSTFLHGVEVITVDSGPRPIATVASSVIGIIGTAPNSAAATFATLVLGVESSNNAIKFAAQNQGANGNNFSVFLKNPAANSQSLAVSVNGNQIQVTGTLTEILD